MCVDLGGDHAGVARARRFDALLVAAVAELDEALVVEPEPRDAAFLRRLDQRARRGTEGAPLRHVQEIVVVGEPRGDEGRVEIGRASCRERVLACV